MYSRKLHIPVVLVRMGTSSNSVETFQHWQKPKNEAIHKQSRWFATHLMTSDNVLFTYFFRSSFRRLISISLYNALYSLFLIITSTKFLLSLIYRISIISRRLYNYLRYRIIIINRLFYIVSSLIKYSYKDLKSIYIKRDIFFRVANI